MKTKFLFLILFVGLIAIFTIATSSNDEEPKPVDHCDKILTFEDDVDNVCADRFENEIREVCETIDPDVETCALLVVMELSDDCEGYQETFDIPHEICFYGKLKNFKEDFETWEENK